VILNSLVAYLEKNGHPLHFTPLAKASTGADLSPLHKNYDAITFLVNSQILHLDPTNNFNPTQPVLPADVIYALKKVLNSIGN